MLAAAGGRGGRAVRSFTAAGGRGGRDVPGARRRVGLWVARSRGWPCGCGAVPALAPRVLAALGGRLAMAAASLRDRAAACSVGRRLWVGKGQWRKPWIRLRTDDDDALGRRLPS